ncbi:MAG: Dabb family protein [Deltaproteobacteria bacterium]|nr:Dabb family protein [Deltaproteobacteria bacterium]
MITHVVLFKLKDPSPESMEKARAALAGLPGKVPVLRHFEVGVDVIRSKRSYDLALLARFDSLETLQAYQVHPKHQEVAKYIKEVSDSIIVVDYES